MNDPIPIWRGSIRNIEGQFGTAIGSFFVFSRFVFLLNLLSVVLWSAFVVLPTAVTFEYEALEAPLLFRNLIDGSGLFRDTWFFFGQFFCILASPKRA